MWKPLDLLKPSTWSFTILILIAVTGGVYYMQTFQSFSATFDTVIQQDDNEDIDVMKKLSIYKGPENDSSYSLTFINNRNSDSVWEAIKMKSKLFLQAKVLITFYTDTAPPRQRDKTKPETDDSVFDFPSSVKKPPPVERDKRKKTQGHREKVKTSKIIKTLTTVKREATTSLPKIVTQTSKSVVKQVTVHTTTETPNCTDIQTTEEFQNRHYICVYSKGRLGNQMFSYAAGYGIAMDKNMTMAVKKGILLHQFFKLDAVKVDNCACDRIKVWSVKRCCSYTENALNFTSDSNYKVGVYLQSWKYFINHTNAVRHQFKFDKPTNNNAEALLHEITEEYKNKNSPLKKFENLTIVGVHIRRGDMFRNKKYQKQGFDIAPTSYISKAMDYYSTKFSRVIFVMCSDSIDWVKSNFNGSNIFYIAGHSSAIDLCVLSLCDHSIMTVGSFGWWGSFLAGGETVYYKYPIRKDSSLRKGFSADYADFFYPGWIGMD